MGGASSPIVAASSDLEVEVGVIREILDSRLLWPLALCARGKAERVFSRVLAAWAKDKLAERAECQFGPSQKALGVKNSLSTSRLFLQRVRRGLKRKELSCRARQKSEGKSKRAVDKRRCGATPLPCFSVSIHSKGVRKAVFVSIDCKGVRGIYRKAERVVGRREAGGKRRAGHAAG